jgi:hypothetical protein
VHQCPNDDLLCGVRKKTAVEHEVIGRGPQSQRKDKHSDHKGGASFSRIHASSARAHPVTMGVIRQVKAMVLTGQSCGFNG